MAHRSNLVIAPGRFDRSGLSLFRAVKVYLVGNDTLLLTEVGREDRVRRLRFIPGVRFLQGANGDGRDDVAFLSKSWKWKVEEVWTERCSDVALPARGGQHVHALFVKRRHRFAKRSVVDIGLHAPAHHDVPAQKKAWVESMRYISGRARTLAWRHDLTGGEAVEVRVSGDFNRSWNSTTGRKELRAYFAPLRCCFEKHPQKDGNGPGGGLISMSFSTMETTSVEVLPLNPSSDHKPTKVRDVL